MSTELPEEIQEAVAHLKNILSTLSIGDEYEGLQSLEVLTGPLEEAARTYAAGHGVYSPHPAYLVRRDGDKAWTPWPDDRPRPTVLDLIRHRAAREGT